MLADEIAILAAPGKVLAQGSPVSLKSKLGQGYVVHVTRTAGSASSVSLDPVLSTIRTHAPLAVADSEPDAYILHSKSAHVVGHVLDALEERKDELGVESYDVRGTTMEAIFLELMGNGDDGEEVPERDELAAVQSKDREPAGAPVLLNDNGAGLKQIHGPLDLSDGRKTSPFRQALTGFHKRALILRRSWLSYALMVVIAVAGACVPLIFMKDRADTCAFAEDFEFISSLYLPEAGEALLPWFDGQAPEEFLPIISPPDLLSVLDAADLPQTTAPDANTFAQILEQTYRNRSIGGLEVQNGNEATVAWEASPGSLSGPALLNLASNVLAKRALGGSAGTGPKIVAYFQNLPGTWIIGTVSRAHITTADLLTRGLGQGTQVGWLLWRIDGPLARLFHPVRLGRTSLICPSNATFQRHDARRTLAWPFAVRSAVDCAHRVGDYDCVWCCNEPVLCAWRVLGCDGASWDRGSVVCVCGFDVW